MTKLFPDALPLQVYRHQSQESIQVMLDALNAVFNGNRHRIVSATSVRCKSISLISMAKETNK